MMQASGNHSYFKPTSLHSIWVQTLKQLSHLLLHALEILIEANTITAKLEIHILFHVPIKRPTFQITGSYDIHEIVH